MKSIFKFLDSPKNFIKQSKTQFISYSKSIPKDIILKPKNLFFKSKELFNHTDIKQYQNVILKIFKSPIRLLEKTQDKIETQVSRGQKNVILKPSRFYISAITWSLLGGSFLGFMWLGLAKTEEIIVVQGKLEPIKKVINVQIPSGNVVSQVLVKEGDLVQKNQVLIILDKESSLDKVLTTKEILDYNEKVLANLKLLSEQGAVSQIQYLQQASQVAQIKSQYTQENIILNYQEIRAPISGKVFEMKPTGKGFVANTSETVLKIVPNDKLKAKVEIDSRKIGFVSVGKVAEISIDSFPSTDFGVINGVVKSIGSDALVPDPSLGKGYRFPAVITLKDQNLKLKNGKSLPLQVGMSLTANIKLRKVSYLQLLLGTFKNKANSLKSI